MTGRSMRGWSVGSDSGGWASSQQRGSEKASTAIIGDATGSISRPETVLLGRFDRRGRLRHAGRSHPLTADQAAVLAGMLSPSPMPRRGAVAHPWPQPLPAAWSGQLDRPEPLPYLQVELILVAEIDADVAFEHGRWRHRVRYARVRADMSVYDVPLMLGEEESYFGGLT